MSLIDELRDFVQREGDGIAIPSPHEFPKLFGALLTYLERGGNPQSTSEDES